MTLYTVHKALILGITEMNIFTEVSIHFNFNFSCFQRKQSKGICDNRGWERRQGDEEGLRAPLFWVSAEVAHSSRSMTKEANKQKWGGRT